MKLRGTHALVTGASHGIGIDIARQLTAKGARVTVTGRDKARTTGVAEQLGAQAIVADLADPAQLGTIVADAEAVNGPLDLLINNAAVALVASARNSKPGQAAELMAVNAVAPMELCRQALPGMLARGRGYLVNVSSLAGVSAVPDMPIYCASKAALHHYTSVLERELAGTPVNVLLATFGEVAGTRMMEESRESEVDQRGLAAAGQGAAHPAPRRGGPPARRGHRARRRHRDDPAPDGRGDRPAQPAQHSAGPGVHRHQALSGACQASPGLATVSPVAAADASSRGS